MKILVPVKQIPDPCVPVYLRHDGSGIQDEAVARVINPFDAIALEAAIQFREQQIADEVIAVLVATELAFLEEGRDHLRTALAMGVDRAIWIDASPQHPEAMVPDALCVAELLADLVRNMAVKLVIAGKQGADADRGQTAPMLAGLLNWAQADAASEIRFNGQDMEEILVEQEVDDGRQTVSVRLPAVITTDLRLCEPRYVTLPDIMRARNKPLEQIQAPSDLVPTVFSTGFSEPPPRKPGGRVADIHTLFSELQIQPRS